MEDWQIVLSIVVPILGVLGVALRHIHNSNKEAHKQIGENIKESKRNSTKASTSLKKDLPKMSEPT